MFTLHHTRNPQLPLGCLNSNTSSRYQLGSKQLCWAKVRWLSHQKSGVSWEDGMSPLRLLGWHGLSLSATEADNSFPKMFGATATMDAMICANIMTAGPSKTQAKCGPKFAYTWTSSHGQGMETSTGRPWCLPWFSMHWPFFVRIWIYRICIYIYIYAVSSSKLTWHRTPKSNRKIAIFPTLLRSAMFVFRKGTVFRFRVEPLQVYPYLVS